MNKRTVRFTVNGTWTVPSGVFFAYGTACGGGSGRSTGSGGGSGSNTTIDFGALTVTGPASPRRAGGGGSFNAKYGPAAANTGHDGSVWDGSNVGTLTRSADNVGNYNEGAIPVEGGSVVVPGASVSVTIGSGGTGTGVGGSGFALIEYEV